ncbi:hypothetical protein ACGFIY_33335 [Micromonospora chersina]|uniref:hypothetical protein n=1 Tax=Micromonospora chersina TaxID=47854 RepID=UPI00371B9221
MATSAYSVLFTLLPNGFTADGRARLSLVASPRPKPGRLDETAVMRWPDIVTAMGTRFLVLTAGGAAPITATVVSPKPSLTLWTSLFPAATPVGEPVDPLSDALGGEVETTSYSAEHAFISELYQQVLDSSATGSVNAGHPAMQALTALNAVRPRSAGAASTALKAADIQDLLDPRKLTRERLRQAAELLASRGYPELGTILPLVPRLRQLQLTAAVGDNPPPGSRPPGPLGVVASAEEPNFANVIGAVMRHPELALKLGLRIDLTMPAFTGQRMIRLATMDGQPLNGTTKIEQPWSAVVSDPSAKRFVMATQNDDRAEIVNGMLDVRPTAGDQARYTVSNLDVVAAGQQIDVLAISLADSAPDALVGLPPRRTAGLTLAQADRRAGRFEHMLARNSRFEGALPNELEGAPVLFADDVTTGYRVDVAAGQGPFRSLMRRVAKYVVGSGANRTEFTAHDEGQLETAVLSQQYDTTNTPHVFLGEELFTWTGWGFGGQIPGPVVGAETNTADHVATVDAVAVPGYPLLINTEVEPGSLTKLRFGTGYRFRVRAVDLAGNSIDPAVCDPALTTPEAVYRRYEPVPPPVIVPRKPYALGESPNRMVVYSDGDGEPLAPSSERPIASERHIAPPKMSQRMGELHSGFDQAFGPNVTQAVRDQIFNLAKREEGSFLDPVVPGPNSSPVPAAGIAVIATDPLNPIPTKLPLTRGEPLAPGEYVIHDTATPLTPYLPDAASSGPALSDDAPGATAAMTAPWSPSGATWPNLPPARLVLRPGKTAATTSGVENGRSVFTIDLPPATETTVRLSSAIAKGALAAMDAPADAAQRQLALAGQNALLSPPEPITLVHAVRKPTAMPTMTTPVVKAAQNAGTTAIDVSASVTAHAASTGKVAIEATWTETVDRGYGPVEENVEHRVTVASSVYNLDDTARQLAGKLDFGDSRHRVVTFRPVAGTRFREYFDVAETDQHLLVREGEAEPYVHRSRVRPQMPQVQAVVPIFERQIVKATNPLGKFIEIKHLNKGVRVYLKRPWHDSGEGQQLGVLVAKPGTAAQIVANNPVLSARTTRWGSDLLDQQPGAAPREILSRSHLSDGSPANPTGVLPDPIIPGIGDNSNLFDILTFPVAYDEDKELWFADIRFNGSGLGETQGIPRFLQLSLVAYQGTSFPQAGYPDDLRSSRYIVTNPVNTTAHRVVQVQGLGTPPSKVGVSVSLADTITKRSIRARWQVRKFDPTAEVNAAPDICVDSPRVQPVSAIVPVGANPSVQLNLFPFGGTSSTDLNALRKGRIIIEEVIEGTSLVPNLAAKPARHLFTEVVELKDLI